MKKITLNYLFGSIVILLVILAISIFFVSTTKSRDKSSIEIQTNNISINKTIKINQKFLDNTQTLYSKDKISNVKIDFDSKNNGESSISLEIDGQEHEIAGYIDSNTQDITIIVELIKYDPKTHVLSVKTKVSDPLSSNEEKLEYTIED